MPLLTTTIGAYPKPNYLPVPDWFRKEKTTLSRPTAEYETFQLEAPADIESLLFRAIKEVIEEQVRLRIDIPTDGEVRRENYIHYHCRYIAGIAFDRLTKKSMRNGAWTGEVPTIVKPLEIRELFLAEEWKLAQSITDRPVKATMPGPMTLLDSLADDYYGDEKKLANALANVLNKEVQSLSEAGCRWIQVDEPLMARNPQKALEFGIDTLARVFHRTSDDVMKCVHICCGYPDRLDSEDYLKAHPEAYFQLAPALDASPINAVSLEDAHRPNDLTLLESFARTTVILGVVAIARSRVESVDEIRARLQQALQHIDPERLMVAPDCGLGMLPRKTVVKKLTNMVQAARHVP